MAVLLCNPFGEEAVRAHRLYRVLASQFESAGYAAMRFDFFGTGDSAGASCDISVRQWLDDIAIATAELERRAGVQRVVLIGLRFGATLAALASMNPGSGVRHLVLWDPVIDGTDYLLELGEMHRAFMAEEKGNALSAGKPSVDSTGGPFESLGTPLLPKLRAEIASIELSAPHLSSEQLTVVCTRKTERNQQLRGALAARPGCVWLEIENAVAWNSDAALNSATVPMEIIRAIVARVEEMNR